MWSISWYRQAQRKKELKKRGSKFLSDSKLSFSLAASKQDKSAASVGLCQKIKQPTNLLSVLDCDGFRNPDPSLLLSLVITKKRLAEGSRNRWMLSRQTVYR